MFLWLDVESEKKCVFVCVRERESVRERERERERERKEAERSKIISERFSCKFTEK